MRYKIVEIEYKGKISYALQRTFLVFKKDYRDLASRSKIYRWKVHSGHFDDCLTQDLSTIKLTLKLDESRFTEPKIRIVPMSKVEEIIYDIR